MEKNKSFSNVILEVNRKIIFNFKVFLILAFILYINNHSSYGHKFLEYLLNFFIKDQNIIINIINLSEMSLTILLVLFFIALIYFLNMKEKIKEKYDPKEKDKTDIKMKNIAENF